MTEQSDRIRVLASVTDPRFGGPQQRILNCAKRLQKRNIETVFLIPKGDNSYAQRAKKYGYEVYRAPLKGLAPPERLTEHIKWISEFLPAVRRIQIIIDENDIDLVHANMAGNYQTAVATYRTGTPLVWHFNDTFMPTPVKQVSAAAAKLLADNVVVASNAVGDHYFHSWKGWKKLYPPVDLTEFNGSKNEDEIRELRKELDISKNTSIVGTVGNLNPIKGHKYLLYAIDKLEIPNVAVPIVGAKLDTRQEYYSELIELRSELGLEDKVQFVGYRSDIPKLLELFDVFVLSSTAEACPIVVLEAMATETPVVATDVGGVREQIPSDQYGLVVPPKNPNALAKAISESLLNDKKSYKRAQRARYRVEKVFSIQTIADQHKSIYKDVLSGTDL